MFFTVKYLTNIILITVQEVVASTRGLQTSTIVSHLSEAIKEGLPVNIEKLGVTAQMTKMITNVIRAPPINSGT